MEKSINEKYREELLFKVISGEATEDESKILKEELKNDDVLRLQYSRMAKAWSAGSLYPQTSKFNSYNAWKKVLPTVKSSQCNADSNNFILNKIVRIAATWLIIFSIGGLTSYFLFKNLSGNIIAENCSSPVETISPLGSRTFIQLPDKSKVWLNAGSKLIYHQDYGLENRKVELIGEGYFDVETNPEKPFIVYAGDLNVRAFGTSFNVKAYPEEKVFEATLVEGMITIEGITRQKKKFVKKLTPGQKLTFNHDIEKLEKIESKKETTNNLSSKETIFAVDIETNVKTEIYTSWKDDKWIIEGEYLDDLIVLLGRRFNVDIELNDEKLKNYKFSGTIRRETLEQVMEILKYSAPIKYKIKKSDVTILLDPSREKNYQHFLDKTKN